MANLLFSCKQIQEEILIFKMFFGGYSYYFWTKVDQQ